MIDAAMIFAAGLGTRMGAMTSDTPKPMLPILGQPMVDYTIDLLKLAGIKRLVANTHYLADKIAPHLEQQGVIVRHEDPVLETGGGLRAAMPVLGSGPVITMNPDAAWSGPNPVTALMNEWQDQMQALLMLVPSPEGSNCDDFSLEHGRIGRIGPFRYTGLQILRTEHLHEISRDKFSLNLYWDLLAESGPVHGIVYDGNWCDVGDPDGLIAAEKMLAP